MVKSSPAKLRAVLKYDNKAYFKTLLRIKKTAELEFKKIIAESGESINGYIINSLKLRIKADTGKDVEL